MTAIIVDDEPLARMMIKEYLQFYPAVSVLQECSDGFEGIKAIQEYQPELIFLDIQMPKISGFEMLELIENPPAVIFTTAFDEYAIKAFDIHAIDYLLKPFSRDRFDKSMQKVFQQIAGKTTTATEKLSAMPLNNNRLVVKENGRIKIIPLDDIHFLEAADDYIKIHTAEKIYLKKKTLQYFEDSLPAQEFIRVHRSFLINAHLITRIDLHEKESHIVLLKTGARIPISKAGYIKLRAVLGI